ncbi:uncharacterized protein [Euwallacea similis]|uniref:uncharacterized protein n=1 Tax=Euwallacea similis TaxID=1736056 RepID=UPI00344FBE8B
MGPIVEVGTSCCGEESVGSCSSRRAKKHSPPLSSSSGDSSDSEGEGRRKLGKNAAAKKAEKPSKNEIVEELLLLINTVYVEGHKMMALVKAHKSTKCEIKESAHKIKICADKMHDNKMLFADQIGKFSISPGKSISVASAASQTDGTLALATREMCVQTGEDSALESFPDETSFQAWKQVENKAWSNMLYTSTEIVIGNPVEDNKFPDETKVVFVEKDDLEMDASIQSQFKKRFPELTEIGDLDILERVTKIKTKTQSKSLGQKVAKVFVAENENGTFAKLVQLKLELGQDKNVAFHHINGMPKGNAAETIKKINSSLGENEKKESIKTIKTDKEGNLIITLEKDESALEALGRDIGKSLGKDNVRLLKERQEKVSVFIRGMDASASKKEVLEALKNKLPDLKEADVAIREMRPYAKSSQAVTVRLYEKLAEKLLESGLRVGLVRCRLERHLKIEKCRNCWAYDHASAQCKGPDRRKCCFRCGKSDHRGKNCTKKDEECVCVLCKEKGHCPGTANCGKFRDALKAARLEATRAARRDEKQITDRRQGTALALSLKLSLSAKPNIHYIMKIQLRTTFLQINANRSIKAHDMAFLEAAKRNADLIVASEPNKKLLQRNPKWLSDNLQNVAIYARTNTVKFSKIKRGDGIIVLFGEEYTIIAGYISPNCTKDQFDQYLNDLQQAAAGRHGELILMGDLNSKSPDCGSTTEDARGAALSQMCVGLDLVALNTGEPTFVRREQQTCIDVTFASENLANRVTNWQILDNEPCSPYRHILFEIGSKPGGKTRLQNGCIKTEKQKFVDTFGELLTRYPEVNSGKELSKIMRIAYRAACDANRNGATGSQNPYWWTEEIDSIRKNCVKARRLALRARGNRNVADVDAETSWQKYKDEKKKLQKEINSRKKANWVELCRKLDEDVWGDGYKIVMRYLKPGNPFELTTPRKLEIAEHLFPRGAGYVPGKIMPVVYTQFSKEEVQAAANKLKNAVAPGPDGMRAEAVKFSFEAYSDVWLELLNQMLENQEFPNSWKVAKLILLLKPNKDSEQLGSYRPICLVDSAAKLYEHLIKNRLEEELEAKYPFSDVQFGFRKNRSAMHAMTRVLDVVDASKNRRGREESWCGLITLDVKNAFNTASWTCIVNELSRRNISNYLINIIKDYFTNRIVKIDKDTEFNMAMGIPQGSVLGPLLWNVMYDPILAVAVGQSERVTAIGYADDIALVVCGSDRLELVDESEAAINRCVQWLTDHSLAIAPEKTEAVILSGKRDRNKLFFLIDDVRVTPKKSLRYLGVEFGENLYFARHVKAICDKSLNKLGQLQKIMPTIDGPSTQKRHLLYGVVQSTLLYAAPVWGGIRKIKKYAHMMLRVQRKALVKVVCAYRTVSYEAVQVLAGIPPIDLLIEERTQLSVLPRVTRADRKAARTATIQKWQDRWTRLEDKGQWTKKLIPDLEVWVSCKHRRLNYYLTQAFSGHGNFRTFTHRIGKTEPDCTSCGIEDTAEHCIFRCTLFETQRNELRICVNALTPKALIETMLVSKKSWDKCSKIITDMVKVKERMERTTTEA